MAMSAFRYFPPERMDREFPWPIWAVGWLALFKAFLWLSYEPVQSGSLLTILGTKYLLNMVPMAIFAIGVWNLKKWAMWGLIILSVANLIFFYKLSPIPKRHSYRIGSLYLFNYFVVYYLTL